MADNDNLKRGRKAPHRPSCACPACRWRRRRVVAQDRMGEASIGRRFEVH